MTLANSAITPAKGRFFYGWVILGVATLSMVTQAAVWLPPLSLFLDPLLKDFGWSRTQISGAVTLGTLGSGVAGALLGRLIDRRGARVLLVAGALLLGGALLAMSRVNALWQFYAAYGLARVLTAGPMWLASTAVVANWFVVKRGTAFGILYLGGNVGMAVWPVLATLFIALWGWRTAFAAFAVLVWVLLVLPAALLLRRRPEDMGLHPDGLAALPVASGAATQEQDDLKNSFTLSEALRTPAFWLLNGAASITCLSIGGMNFHQIPYLQDVGFDSAMAVSIVSTFALVCGVSGLVWGFIADRMPVRYTLTLVFGLSGLGALLLLAVRSPAMGFTYAVFYGLAAGGMSVVTSMVWAHYFGRGHVGSIIGFSTPFQAAMLALGPLVGGWAYDTLGSYNLAIWSFAIAYALGALMAFAARPPVKKTVTEVTRASAPV